MKVSLYSYDQTQIIAKLKNKTIDTSDKLHTDAQQVNWRLKQIARWDNALHVMLSLVIWFCDVMWEMPFHFADDSENRGIAWEYFGEQKHSFYRISWHFYYTLAKHKKYAFIAQIIPPKNTATNNANKRNLLNALGSIMERKKLKLRLAINWSRGNATQ